MHSCFKRWFAIVLHRRAGKTTAWLNHHQRAAVDDGWETERLRFLEPKFTDAEIRELLRVRVYQRFGREVRMIDYLEGQESDGIPQIITELQRKPYVWGRHFAPHDIKATDCRQEKRGLKPQRRSAAREAFARCVVHVHPSRVP
jgi:hypothetical protein